MVFARIMPERHSWVLTAGSILDARWHGGAACCELDVEKQKSKPEGLRTERECPSNAQVPLRAALYSTRDHRVPQGTSSWEQLAGACLWRTGNSDAEARDLDMSPVSYRAARCSLWG